MATERIFEFMDETFPIEELSCSYWRKLVTQTISCSELKFEILRLSRR
jgi:hypothetical protein